MYNIKKIIITGGSGFIGSHLVKIFLKNSYKILNLDKLNYCSNYQLFNNKNYSFTKIDLADEKKVSKIIKNLIQMQLLIALQKHMLINLL